MYCVDHPRLTARSQRQIITLDRAYPDHAKLKAALERLLGGDVRHMPGLLGSKQAQFQASGLVAVP